MNSELPAAAALQLPGDALAYHPSVPDNRIREIRQQRALMVPAAFTLAAVAKRVGVTEAAMRRWEMGTSRPRLRHLRALARELGVSVEQLGFRDAPAPESPNGDDRH